MTPAKKNAMPADKLAPYEKLLATHPWAHRA